MQPPKANHDPKMIGLWKVGRTLGKGFSGHVRIARHSKTGQFAAIKIIPKGSLGSRISLNRLADEVEHSLLAVEREIVVMKLLDHPNVMKLYDVWETSTSLYLILEYVQGGELFEYLCNEGRRPVSEALGYFQQIICAVDYCHRFNIAHRDLKLENILIDQNADIKVADFGMATWQDEARGKLLRTSCGSPHYAAPEVISGKPYNGAIADIWSCGIILYALLAARLPFDDEDCPALLQKIAVGKYTMPTDIDPRAQNLISRMLTTDVQKRISMQDIMRHPFFQSQPLKNPAALPSDPNIDTIAHPIGSLSAIDPDIFANLRTLWHGTKDAELVESLMNADRNWQKGIYHLLMNYRRKYLGSRQDEEELAKSRKKTTKQVKTWDGSDSSLPSRTGPPTPRRAKGREGLASSYTSMSFVHIERPLQDIAIPAISLSTPSDERSNPSIITVEPEDLSVIMPPELEDEKIQVFFQQVANHLNVLQARTASIGSPQPGQWSAQTSPVPSIELPMFNIKNISPATPESRTDRMNSDSSCSPLPADLTRPLSVRRKSRQSDKENAGRITESDLVHRQSPLQQHTERLSPFSATTPSGSKKPGKLRKSRPSPMKQNLDVNRPSSPLFSEAGSSFSAPSPGPSSKGGVGGDRKRSWLDGVLKFKPASYRLLSRHDMETTRTECRRLLTEMDLLVSVESGVLKCRSQDAVASRRAGGGGSSGKIIKFRVELQWSSADLCEEGYVVSCSVVHEKGSLEAFKGMYEHLVRTWTLGWQEAGSESVLSGLSSTGAVGG